MAAQEKAKTASKRPEPVVAPPVDLLDDAPPPAFDETVLPPPTQTEEAPPPFETVEQQSDPPPSFDILEEQPPAYEEMKDTAPTAPMAPAYEDLLDHAEQQNSLENIEPMQAPTSAMEEEIMGMEGLTDEERRALIEEQRQIMAQIEQEKQANAQAIANAQADAFDQRSAPAVARAATDGPTRSVMPPSDGSARTVDLGGGQQVALHGQERTRAAIADGTAILVQCVHCQNWMQVTDTATLMYCPVCSVVSPVERQTAVLTKEEAMQMSADRRMAEQLQQEEYADQEEEEEEESWWDSVTSLFVTKSSGPAQPQPQQVAPRERGEMGVSLPPGSIPERGGLVAARTGNEEETITFSNSFEEREGLLLNDNAGSGMPKARVAERQPLFSCVVDSVSTAASSMAGALTTTTLSEDNEGNVHGVDSSSLLAVTRAGRGGGSEDQEYQPLNQD